VAFARAAPAFKRTVVGEAVRDFELGDTNGQTVRLSGSLGAKATVIVFWATWNPRSTQILGDLQQVYAEHSGNGLQILAVNAENAEWDPATVDRIAATVAETGAAYPVLVDRDLTVYNEFGVVAMPSMVLADAQGTIIELRQGYPTSARLEFRESILTALGVLVPAPETDMAVRPEQLVSPKVRRKVEMGRLLIQRKRPSRAVEPLEQAVAEDSTYAEAYRLLAEALEQSGRSVEAQAARDRLDQLEKPVETAAAPPGAGGAATSTSPTDGAEKTSSSAAPTGQ
jgi:peroxiredoxin